MITEEYLKGKNIRVIVNSPDEILMLMKCLKRTKYYEKLANDFYDQSRDYNTKSVLLYGKETNDFVKTPRILRSDTTNGITEAEYIPLYKFLNNETGKRKKLNI